MSSGVAGGIRYMETRKVLHDAAEVDRRRRELAESGAWADLIPVSMRNMQRLGRAGTVREVEPGTLVAAAHHNVDKIVAVLSGELHLATRLPEGGRHLVGLVQDLCVIGDSELLCGHRWAFDALAARRSLVLEVCGDAFLGLMASEGGFGRQWATSIARRLEESQRRHVAMLTKDLRTRLATFLLQERRRAEEGGWEVRVTQQTIADLMGAQRQSVSRLLSEFREAELIAGRYGVTVVTDLEGLAEVAGQAAAAVPRIDHAIG